MVMTSFKLPWEQIVNNQMLHIIHILKEINSLENMNVTIQIYFSNRKFSHKMKLVFTE